MKFETESQNIKEPVAPFLKDMNSGEAAEHKDGTMAAAVARRLNVRRLVESALRSLKEYKVEEQTKEVLPEQESTNHDTNAKEARTKKPGRVICKFSATRGVAVHDSSGETVVSLRDYYRKNGKLVLSTSGINLSIEQWSAFRKSIPDIEAAITKMGSRIRSEDATKQVEAASSNPVSEVAKLKETTQTGDEISGSVTDFAPHSVIPMETNQAEADLSSSVTAFAPRGPTDTETKQTKFDVVKAFPPREITPFETNEPEEGKPNSVTASDPQELVHTVTVTKLAEADISNALTALAPEVLTQTKIQLTEAEQSGSGSVAIFAPQGLTPEEAKQTKADKSTHVTAVAPQEVVPIQVPRLDGKNHHGWVHQMKIFLKQLKIAYVLSDPCPCSSVGLKTSPKAIARVKAAVKKWADDDYMCHHIILSSLSDHVYDLFSKKTRSAKELWEELRLAYDKDFGAKRTKVSKVNEYIQFQMIDEMSIIQQAEELDGIANSIIASGMGIDEKFRVSVIISKLPPSWKEYRAKLMHGEHVPLNTLMHRLKCEEESRNRLEKQVLNMCWVHTS